MLYFADANGGAVGACLCEETHSIFSATGLGKLLREEIASCLVSSLPTQLFSLTHIVDIHTRILHTV